MIVEARSAKEAARIAADATELEARALALAGVSITAA